MTPRERLQAVLEHRPADRLCVDLGAGGQTGIGVCALHRLRQAILHDRDYLVKVYEPYQMLGQVDDDLRRALALDVVGIPTRCTMFGFTTDGWKPFTMPDGTTCLVPGGFNVTRDNNGDYLMHPQGDLTCPPCARMPSDGYFFDSIPRQRPILEDQLDPNDNLEEFEVLSEQDLQYYHEQVTRAYQDSDYGIYLTIGGAAFGDIALVPAPWLKDPKGIRDVEEWYISLVKRPWYIKAVFDRQLEIALKNIELLAGRLGNRVQVAFVSGTDFGTQESTFCSLQTFRDLFKPYLKAVCDQIHRLTNWKVFVHSCGAIYPLIPELIEAGVDVLNPVQCSAAGMDPRQLKKEFGKDLVFWGGGVDTQRTLPFGSPEEVYRQVRERIDIFFEDGTGYVFSPIHNILSNVPVENILAMFKAVNDARGL
ncbi:MAG: uroporphyrinogen decarboxylase family protein [Sedimentisphaerales bacterium]|nr:uroporphyrinogen decarboxylase family protein [Sedimentisphaerales bacterium]